MDIASFGTAKVFGWTKEHLLEVLAGGKNPILQPGRLHEAFAAIDRADFLPNELRAQAYQDVELEFGMGQQLNSPVVVAQMLSCLNLQEGQKVLELGTGTGYSAALIAHVLGSGGKLFTLERNQHIYELAKENLAKYTQLQNYELVYTDGRRGLVARAPFAAIHVSFAYEEVPHELLVQLEVGGKLVTPLTNQEIKLYERVDEQNVREELISVKNFTKAQEGVE